MGIDQTLFDQALERVRQGTSAEEAAKDLYDELTEEERLWLLDGDQDFWVGLSGMNEVGYNATPYVHGAVARLGIPGIRFVDGPRGCVSGQGTAFPVSMARGATWDLELEEEIGRAIGEEIRSQGGNFFGGVCINLPRHPAWGRAQETYGDEPYHLGEMGAALTRGTQEWVMACGKHYALNSMENARFKVDVRIDEADLHEIYLPHFKRLVDEGVAALMSAYNSVNGEWAGQNEYLLTTVLREQWGWDGITVSDFIWGLRDAAKSLNAGLDLEEPLRQQRAANLERQIAEGESSWEMVERAGIRLLAAQLRSYASRNPQDPTTGVMASSEHRALARLAGARAMVLLKNEPVDGTPVLPVPADTQKIAMIGRLATQPNMGDKGSSDVHPPEFVTPYEGIVAAYPHAQVILVDTDDVDACVHAAAEADVAIVVAGFDMRDEGEYVGSDVMNDPALLATFPPIPEGSAMSQQSEADDSLNPVMTGGDAYGGDRKSLRLREVDAEIIRAVASTNQRTVVAVVAAGAVLMEEWRSEVPAIVMMWYAGMEGGHALADVLSGKHNPSGRLPFSIPTSEDHLPEFHRDATTIEYGHFHGQRLLDNLGVDAAYPHGFGLSYCSFEIESAALSRRDGDSLVIDVEVANSGSVGGRHVVQVYGEVVGSDRGAFVVGFAPIDVGAGKTVSVAVPVSLVPLATWDYEHREMRVPAGPVKLSVGSFAHDPQSIAIRIGG